MLVNPVYLNGECGDSDNPLTLVENFSELTGAFDLHKAITHVEVPNGVTTLYGQGLTTTRNACFSNFIVLESVSLPDTLTIVGEGAFMGCSSLKELVIPDGVTSLGVAAFYNCNILETIVLPAGISSIPRQCFAYCYRLKSIYYKGSESQWEALTKDTNWNSGMGNYVQGGTQIICNYTG